MNSRGRVCLNAPYLFPLFSDRSHELTGGAEVQQALIARGLAAQGFEVFAATCDFGQPAEVTVDGITLLRTFPPFGGFPGVRFFHPRLSRTLAALGRADADVYYARGAGLQAGLTFEVARARGAAFVYGAAHDDDARASLPQVHSVRDRWWYLRALRGADLVVAQTESQRGLFRTELAREAVVVPNMVERSSETVDPAQEGVVLWLGTWKSSKRPEWVIELARRMPERRFVMSGVIPPPPGSPAVWEAARVQAAALSNLEVLGFTDHDRIGELFRRASLFIHTSPSEGFPNTLLEAWAHGVPSVSAVDPDGVIQREGIGDVAVTWDAVRDAVRRRMSDAEGRRAVGARARAWVARHHGLDETIERLGERLDALVRTSRRSVRAG